MIGKLDTMEIERVVSSQIIGRIACHANNTTYIVPISYAYDGTYVYGHTREGLKMQLMRKNNQVCFEVEEIKDMANWKTVVAQGRFEELKDEPERDYALKMLTARILPLISSETTHLYPLWPFPTESISTIRGIVFRILLNEKSGRFETNAVTSPKICG